MEKLSKQLDLQSMNLKKFTLGTPEYDEALKALNKTQDKYKAASAGLKQSQNFKSLVDGLGKPELDDFRKTIDRVSEGMATDFRTLFTAGTKEGNTFFINLGGEEGRVSLQGNNIHFDQQTGTIQGIEDQQKKERIMNYLREKRIVEERKALQSLAPEQIPYFDQHWNSAGYATLLPEKIFEGAVTMSDNPEVPTESFYQHLQKHKGDYVQYPIMKTIEGTNLRRKVYINVQVTDDYLDEIARKLGSFQSQQQNPFVQ